MKMLFIVMLSLASMSLLGQELTVVYDAYSYITQKEKENGGNTIYRLSLQIKDGKSKYSRDSVLLKKPVDIGVEKWDKRVIFKDYKKNRIVTQSAYFKEGWYHSQKMFDIKFENEWDWKETGNTKIICDLECIELVDGDEKVYYAPEIAVWDGPYTKMFNLPGLVLEYDSGKSIWLAKNIVYSSDAFEVPTSNLEEDKDLISEQKWKKFLGFDESEAIKISSSTPVNKWLKYRD